MPTTSSVCGGGLGGGDGRDDLAVRRLGAGLLGFLLRATGAVAVELVADAHLSGERLGVVGTVVGEDVLGDTETVLGRELLQRRLPVEAGPHRGGFLDQRVEEAVDDRGGRLDPATEVHRADHGLDGVGEDRGLVTSAGRLLAAPELDVVAEPDPDRHHCQGPCVDDGGAQLGEPTLGQVGVHEVESLGHHDPEHGVAEELEPLVGGQPAVLVGERAMRQGALKELGVQDRIPELRAQLCVVADDGLASRRLRGPGDARRGRRTGRTCHRHGAAGAWRRTRGSRRSPGSAP